MLIKLFMGFRISHIHDYDRFIAIDLGSYRVRACVYSMHDGKIRLDGSACIRQYEKNISDGVIVDMQGVAQVIEKAIHKACAQMEEIPSDIIIGFTPEICIYDALASQYIRQDPEIPLNMDELDTMIQKIEKASLIRAKKKAKTEYAIIHDDIRLISSTITSVMIDGKIVTHPIGYHGKHVRINIINIYSLSSEYNIIRSILSSLKKQTISIVPMPIILPKILEKSPANQKDSIYINIGYNHVVVIFEQNQEIIFFDTFTKGSKMLMDIFLSEFPEYSYTEIENILQREDPEDDVSQMREKITQEYFSYIIDILSILILKQEGTIRLSHIVLSGGIFGSDWIQKLFSELFDVSTGYDIEYTYLPESSLKSTKKQEYPVPYGLSLLGQELLHTKKDPIIRILRYTLYNYE